PAGFSCMADGFATPETALASHVPGVNVLYLDGHADDYDDPTEDGSVLYDNGLTNWRWRPAQGPGAEFNWIHDDIWMIIDGYHQPAAGQ
ncbi:hypothetical protein LCGC14_2407980, partial [marine sediment metagenome]